jgi:DNA-binding response OmpR family regulator
VEVAVIRWPGDEEKRASMLASQQPHLLLVESGPPPIAVALIEDWIRVPAPAVDIEARLESLRCRSSQAALPEPGHPSPRLGADGILRFRDSWVSLSPLEVRLVSALMTRPDTVVTRQALIESGWPLGGEGRPNPRRNALDAHMLRLRQRLPAVGLTVRTIRSRGYMLEQVAGGL